MGTETAADKERLLTRARKLLALAEGTPSEGEMMAAMLKVQTLLVKHGLTVEDVRGGDADPREVVNLVVDTTGKVVHWRGWLAGIVAQNFRCETYWERGGRQQKLRFIGMQEDAELAAEVYAAAQMAVENMVQFYLKRRRGNRKVKRATVLGWRNAYIAGFLEGLAVQFKEQVERNNWALVLVRDRRVDETMAAIETRRVSSATHYDRDQGAFAAGFVDGKHFEHRAVARGRAIGTQAHKEG